MARTAPWRLATAPVAGLAGLIFEKRRPKKNHGHEVRCWFRNEPEKMHRNLWEEFGVKRASLKIGGDLELEALPTAFRAGNDEDLHRIRNMRGECIDTNLNPGLRVEPNFIDEKEEEELAEEFREIVGKYGFCFDAEMVNVHMVDSTGNIQEIGRNRSKRVTGRPESREGQMGIVAPWGYGADLDMSELPKAVHKIVQRLRDKGYQLGPLRDCTINHRTGSFFMIHPHVDPLTDGPNVFVLGILSGAVLTFTPDGVDGRRGLEVEEKSWTDQDLDVIIRRRSIAAFTGDARYKWRHGIRAGMQLQAPELGNRPVVCDFWGSMKYILPRKDERFSLVLAFSDA